MTLINGIKILLQDLMSLTNKGTIMIGTKGQHRSVTYFRKLPKNTDLPQKDNSDSQVTDYL